MGNRESCSSIVNSDPRQWSVAILPHSGSALYLVITSFFFGLIFAPWSAGLLFLILFIVALDIIIAYVRRQDDDWFLLDRTAIGGAAILGFIVGRTIIGDDDPVENKPSLMKDLTPGL